jgi:hypothetical protein
MRRSEYVISAWRHLVLGCVVSAVGGFFAVPGAFAAFRPVIGKELVSEVSATEAKLGALVNPEGSPATYRFEYGATPSFGSSAPSSEGSAGDGLVSRAVWAAATGLTPGGTYHYRIAITNERGTTYGPDQTFTTLTPEQAACPNGEFRSGFSARLPDCRAYELVTPAVKTSVEFDRGVTQSSVVASNGDALSMITREPFPGAPTGGFNYVATRAPGGWSLANIDPFESYTGVVCVEENEKVPAYSADISRAVISIGSDTRASQPPLSNKEACNSKGLQVVAGEPVGYQNLLLRNNRTGEYRLINNLEAAPPGVTPADANFQSASADLSHVVFSEEAPLAPGAQYGVENMYEWDEGVVRLVTWLPDGTPAIGSLAAEKSSPGYAQAISDEGSHIFFTSGGSLYVRIDGERSVQIDRMLPGAGGTGGGGVFQVASSDGSRVFFTDTNKLTLDSTAGAGQPDLYECVLLTGATECQLTDVTATEAGEQADVTNVSALGSQDSSHVYFIATGVLAANKREYTDSNGKPVVEEAKKGEENLYVSENDRITFIATLNEREGRGIVSPDGAWFAFLSKKSLTGYDNIDALGSPAEEIFLYSASSGQLACASCLPTGEAPVSTGPEAFAPERRYLMNDGRLFFETYEGLVPSDANGQLDVYEYEGDQASLISSGTSSFESIFLNASESGDDVFISSTQQLLPQDTQEGMFVIYDARVKGGLPFVFSPPECGTPEGCRGPASAQAALYGAPSSQTFSGTGNLALPAGMTRRKSVTAKRLRCHRGFMKRRGRCVKSKRSRKTAPSRRRGKSNHREGR